MLLILSYEQPVWRVHASGPDVEGEGATLEEAFANLYNEMAKPDAQQMKVTVVQDYSKDSTGLYRIQLKETHAGLSVHSMDILGLSYAGTDPEAVMLKLPEECRRLLSEQGAFNRHT